MNGQTILITGATHGLGRALAEQLAIAGARVIIHGRDEALGQTTRDDIARSSGNPNVEWQRADFSDLREVDALARRITQSHPRLDVLINNAGIGGQVPDAGARRISAQGYELRFAVNYLAGFALTNALNPARVINVSSEGLEEIDFDDVMLERNYDGNRAYFGSKLAQVMMTFDLSTRTTATALHPETYMPTSIVLDRPTPPAPERIGSLEVGVRATIRLFELPPARVNGRYFHREQDVTDWPFEQLVKLVGERSARGLRQAHDPAARAKLRQLSEQLTG